MKRLLLGMATFGLCVWGAAANAAFYSVSIGPSASFDGFIGNLGTLTKVEFNLSGTTIYDIQLPGQSGGVPPSGTVTYNLTNGLFAYVYPSGSIPFNYQPYLQQTGSGQVEATFGAFQATTSGAGGISIITDPDLLAAFVNTTFTGSFTADPPFNGTISAGGNSYFLGGVTFTTFSKTVSGEVTYTYDAAGVRDVPEPASWCMFIGGFGLVGSALRRRRREAHCLALTRASLRGSEPARAPSSDQPDTATGVRPCFRRIP